MTETTNEVPCSDSTATESVDQSKCCDDGARHVRRNAKEGSEHTPFWRTDGFGSFFRRESVAQRRNRRDGGSF